MKGRGITAQGRDTEAGFVVYQGSRAAKTETDSLHQYVRTQHAALLASGVLVDATDTLALAQDYPFSSPSTAAAVMLGAAANGRTEWKDATGKTLKELQG